MYHKVVYNLDMLNNYEIFKLYRLNERFLNGKSLSEFELSVLNRFEINSCREFAMPRSVAVHGINARGRLTAQFVVLFFEKFDCYLEQLPASTFVPFVKCKYRSLSYRKNLEVIVAHCMQHCEFVFNHVSLFDKKTQKTHHALFNFHPSFLFHTHAYIKDGEIQYCYENSPCGCSMHKSNIYFYDYHYE